MPENTASMTNEDTSQDMQNDSDKTPQAFCQYCFRDLGVPEEENMLYTCGSCAIVIRKAETAQ